MIQLITQAMRLCNPHQRPQFLAFLIQQREDQAMFGPDAVIADRIAPWPCDAVPGIVAAWSGPFCVQAFLPEPRPIPCDPFFQPDHRTRPSRSAKRAGRGSIIAQRGHAFRFAPVPNAAR